MFSFDALVAFFEEASDGLLADFMMVGIGEIIFSIMLVRLIFSFAMPEKVLTEDTVAQLVARKRKPRNYLRYWRFEMVLSLLLFSIATVYSMIAWVIGEAPSLAPPIAAFVALGIVTSLVTYFGRGYYFGKWKLKMIVAPQSGQIPTKAGVPWSM